MTVTTGRDVIDALRGHELDDEQLTAVLRALTAERHQAYQAGRAEEREAIREASIAIRQATDWPALIDSLDDATAARARRAILLNPAPRPGDYPGRDNT